ncbi:cell surface hyaluronidase CEMIP2-like [Babylonia areolata]|uniref:cell surface hyaluronidase CEMIP2-like n=1 Tax=Babylonia areolata TaxID=304850 RepID=UPI003FD1484B
MSVLLDVSPPGLESLEIQAGGKLVWGDVEGLVLKTGHIDLHGKLIVGQDTPDCRMEKKAKILLTGLRDSDVKLPIQVFDEIAYTRKLIIIRAGAELELHGAEKKSWTKLTATIPSVDSLCATVFDIEDSDYKESASGLQVIVWNPDGTLFDFNVFNMKANTGSFAKYMSEIPDGKIVGVAVSQSVGDTEDDSVDWESVYKAMETLGAQQIRSVSPHDAYAFVVLKGQKASAKESLEDRCLMEGNRVEGQYVSYTDWSKKLQFSVRSVADTDDSPAKPQGADFKVFNTDVIYPVIKLKDDVSSWNVGDEIVVASTDFDWRQAEVKKILPCDTCRPDQIRVDGAFQYSHYGEISLGVDERAEVGVLTQSVVVEGEVEDTCYVRNEQEADLCDKFGKDTYGGHILGEIGLVAFHSQNVELYHMGQQGIMGSYPLHFHMMGDGTGQWFRKNSVHHSFQRCFVVHGTDNSEVSDNVCFDHLGHGLFLEDSAEQHNVIRGNLVLGTQHGTTLMSDRHQDWCHPHPPEFCDGLSSYWITHPNNVFEDNVAAGSDNAGYWFVYADLPLGLSGPVQAQNPDGVKYKDTRYTPVKRFFNNVAHSNEQYFQDVYAPENAILTKGNNFIDPREPNNENGDQRVQYLESSADNTSVELYDCMFVGETANKGKPFFYVNRSEVYGDGPFPTHQFDRSIAMDKPEHSLTAVSFAKGPYTLTNCYFDQYKDWYWNDEFQQKWGYRPLRRGGAISFRRENIDPSVPSNGVRDMKFGFCDKEDNGNWVLNRGEIFEWHMMDGNLQNQFRDYDGSVTGQAGTQLVRDLPFFTDDRCVYHDNWGMAACPYDYAKVRFTGNTGVLYEAKGAKTYPVTMRRDDVHKSPLILRGDDDIEFLTMKNRSYTVNFNGSIPKDITITGINMERGDVIRLGICLPKDTTQIKVRSHYLPIRTDMEVNTVISMAELDQDDSGYAVFYDKAAKAVNMVFVKLISRETRQYTQEKCPGSKCVDFTIERLDGGDGPRDCSSFTFPPFDDSLGIGAPVQDATPADVLQPTCVSTKPPAPAKGRYMGCFLDIPNAPILPYAEQFLYKSMTVQICLDRCRAFNYRYAGLKNGVECRCGGDSNEHQVSAMYCSTACSGKKAEKCGGDLAMAIYSITQ